MKYNQSEDRYVWLKFSGSSKLGHTDLQNHKLWSFSGEGMRKRKELRLSYYRWDIGIFFWKNMFYSHLRGKSDFYRTSRLGNIWVKLSMMIFSFFNCNFIFGQKYWTPKDQFGEVQFELTICMFYSFKIIPILIIRLEKCEASDLDSLLLSELTLYFSVSFSPMVIFLPSWLPSPQIHSSTVMSTWKTQILPS